MPACQDVQHEAFAQAYVFQGYSRVLAYKEAGYAGTVSSSAHYIFHKPEVQQRIHELQAEKAQSLQATAQRTMLELGRIGFGDIRDLFNEDGDLLPVAQLDPDAAARISSIDVEVHWQGKGEDAVPVSVKKIRTYDKMAALTLLAKHFKIVGDEGDGVNALASALADRLRQARKHRHTAPQGDVVDVEAHMPPPAAPQLDQTEQLW